MLILVLLLSFTLFLLWLLLAAAGIGFWRQQPAARLLGSGLLLLSALALIAQLALGLIPVGIGEPLLRIDPSALFGSLALAGLAAAGMIIWLRTRFALKRRPAAVATALLPLLAGAALWGAAYASTPLRERERNASRRDIVLPAGFTAEIYASSANAAGGLDNPTVMTFGPDGELYVADIAGNLWLGKDADGDHKIDALRKIADGFELLVGIAKRGDELFVSSAGAIEALRDSNNDGTFDERRTLVDKLPAMILLPHSNNSLTFGPDGRLYFGVGGTVQRGPEPQPLAGSILSVSPDGGDVKVYARGFDNAFDLAFTSTGEMFAGDNATTPAGEKAENDEFNQIVEGANYGEDGTFAPLAAFAPHSTPTGMTIYTGRAFPQRFFDTAFVALWNKGDVMHMELVKNANGRYQANPAVFGSGFLYPIDIVVGPDEALYIADFGTSVIYRVTYAGN